jgi:hypothetical protein
MPLLVPERDQAKQLISYRGRLELLVAISALMGNRIKPRNQLAAT